MTSDVNNKWYPYFKVIPAFYSLRDADKIPKMICNYLLDAPQNGYTPKDDNDYPRCRFWKYLYYDGSDPLSENLPSISEKMSVLFDPTKPECPPTEKGYRLIPQIYVKQAQTTAQTVVYVYPGRTVPSNEEMKISLGITFMIWTHYTEEANTKTDVYARSFAIEQAIIEALHGVNMAGIGTFSMSKAKHPDCGSDVIFDGNTDIGRRLTMALELATEEPRDTTAWENMPPLTADGVLRTPW